MPWCLWDYYFTFYILPLYSIQFYVPNDYLFMLFRRVLRPLRLF